jgi:hypothetical protein
MQLDWSHAIAGVIGGGIGYGFREWISCRRRKRDRFLRRLGKPRGRQ